MKLLILTQKIDINDDILGFFHRWVEEFAKHCEKVIVICLQKGEYRLPENVKVLSLGKEQGRSKIKYIFNFYKYIWQERKNYDAIFAHMNSEYVVLGGLLWKLLKKKILLWNNHLIGNLATRLAVKIADKSFYTSPFSFNARKSGKKGKQMPAGIDIEKFKSQNSNLPDGKVGFKTQNRILSLGRISPVKGLKILIEAVKLLDKEKIDFVLNIAGEPGEKDREYFEKIRILSKELESKGKIKFLGKISNYKTPEIYNQNEIFINLTNLGSLDKTILEAMSCEILVLVSNKSFEGILPEEIIFEENNAEDLKKKLIALLKKDEKEKEKLKKKLRDYAVKNHSLSSLIQKILYE